MGLKLDEAVFDDCADDHAAQGAVDLILRDGGFDPTNCLDASPLKHLSMRSCKGAPMSEDPAANPDTSARWDVETLQQRWIDLSEQLARDSAMAIPAIRIRAQADMDGAVSHTIEQWPQLTGDERKTAWVRMQQAAENGSLQIAPMCVRSGDCCRVSSPTLLPDDTDLVRNERIPWHAMMTLRQGELARSPVKNELVVLEEEHIKIRERPGSHACVLFDTERVACTIYDDRPIQCRAQACWDPEPARSLLEQRRLSRRDLFADVQPILVMIEAHDNRCSFASLREVVESLQPTRDENVNRVVNVIAFEDHFRREMANELDIPIAALDLILGRSFTELVRLFGLDVEDGPDGTRTLRPAK
ncbi:YkgJ family cysteine cluster protein [Myxococcota bacterium]